MSDQKTQQGVSARLMETLLAQNLVSREELEKAVELQRERGGSLSRWLVELKLVDAKTLAGALSRILQIPTISLAKLELDRQLMEVIPRSMAHHHQIVPVSRIGQQLTLAMADPLNILTLDHVGQTTGLTLVPLITTQEEIQEALHRLYGDDMKETLAELKGSAGQELGGSLELLAETDAAPQESAENLIRLTQESPIVRVTNSVLAQGAALKASDILVEPFEKKLRILYRVDGVFREGESPPVSLYAGIVSRIKVMANLNITEHRLPQDGRIKFSTGGRDVDYRVSVMPSYYGEKVCLRILDKAQAMLDIDSLGFDPKPLKALKDAVMHPHGMVLITGPTGSGKTTSMYSLLKLVDRPDKNLVTIEDPVEFDLPGINQVSVRPEIGLTFAAGLRSILRQDPNVIMVGEIRDDETADIAVKAALTGHLVLSTLHTNDAIVAVARLANRGIDPYLIASSLLLVGAQRLPRTVCLRCREPVHPSREMIGQLGLPADGHYMRGKGCPHCRGTGLAGRVGLLEAIPLTAALRPCIEKGVSSVKLREAVCGLGLLSLRDYAVSKAAAGMIPLEEIARTTVGHQD